MSQAALEDRRRRAVYARDEGKVLESEALLSAVLDEIETAGASVSKGFLCQCLGDRATTRRRAGRDEEALEDLQRVAALAPSLPLLDRGWKLLTTHHLVGMLHLDRTSTCFDVGAAAHALEALRAVGVHGFAWVEDQLAGHLAFVQRDWRAAVDLSTRARRGLVESGNVAGAARIDLQLAEALLELGALAEADESLRSAEALFERFGPPSELCDTKLLRARWLAASEEHERAWEVLRGALDDIGHLVRHFRAVADQQRFLRRWLPAYDRALRVALVAPGVDGVRRAWTVVERAKSFYLVQLLANADVALFDGEGGAVQTELAALDERSTQLERALGGRETDQSLDPLRLEAATLAARRAALVTQQMQSNQRWAALRAPPSFDLDATLARLKEPWIALSFYWEEDTEGGAQLHTFYCRPDGAPAHEESTWSRDELADIDRVRARLQGPLDYGAPILPDGIAAVVPEELATRLLRSDGGLRLLVSPHGRLHGLPIHAITLDGGSRVLDHAAVMYTPSLAVLSAAAPRDAPHEGRVLLLGCARDGFGGRALDEVPAELEALRALWNRHAEWTVTARHLGPEDTLESVHVGDNDWSSEVVHIACHGVFPADHPLDAALRLGREAVRATRFFRTRLGARLVSLSACALGRRADSIGGARAAGDEWLGLYLPMLYAGARAMLVSLWDADSGVAAQLMVSFHEGVAAGEDVAEALRAALRPRAVAPHVRWANWYLVGVPEGVKE